MRFKSGLLTLAVFTLSLGAFPRPVNAMLPRFSAIFEAKSLTAGGDFANPVTASSGDTVRFKAVLTNTQDGTTAKDVTVKIGLYASVAAKQNPTFHVQALNSVIQDRTVTVLIKNSYAAFQYIPGTARITKGGSTRSVSPDTASANITTQLVPVGDIGAGDGNSVTVEFEAKLASKPAPAVLGETITTATSSAVAKTTPKTGFEDPIITTTLEWMSLGLGGLVMRKWAKGLV